MQRESFSFKFGFQALAKDYHPNSGAGSPFPPAAQRCERPSGCCSLEHNSVLPEAHTKTQVCIFLFEIKGLGVL